MRKRKHLGVSSARPSYEKIAKRKNERGITLIALIITIIVMLILVAVSISIALNTGLFESAGKATGDWKTAQDAETELGNGKVNVGGTVYNSIDEYIATIGGENTGGTTVVAGERTTENSTYTDNAGKKAVIPKGFTVSGVKNDAVDETTIDGGLVIYLIPEEITVDWEDGEEVANAQKEYDQFVWIPIKNTTDANDQDINDMYICQGKTGSNGVCEIKVVNGIAECQTEAHKTLEIDGITYKNTLMAGRLYATSTGENFGANYTEVYTPGSGLREPDTLSFYDGNSTYLGYLSSILGTPGYETEANFKDSLQKEYNEVVKSVYLNQGFYVGRYETSNIKKEDGTTIKVVAGTKTGINNGTWYHMYAQEKEYAKNKGLEVGSTMIQGAAYDQVLKFVDPTSKWVTSTGRVAHDLNNYYQTGGLDYNGSITYNDVAKNIYDLEGNVRAWNTTAYDNGQRIHMGRCFL